MDGLCTQKKIILGVTGSIAAYKAVYLTRLLIREGAEVRVIMTPAATAFVSPLTFSTLSRNRVFTEIIDDQSWNSHVDLGLWGDLMLVAPATASTIAKCANGICDNMLVATYLSARCPVFFAPAMDLDMWKHPSTFSNLDKLRQYGNGIIPVGHGELASGLVGDGRMAEPEEILDFIVSRMQAERDFHHKKVVVNAGPTHEPIDPVRFIGNNSSGKMGIQIAGEFARRGAEVTLVLGPAGIEPDEPGIRTIRVRTAEEMYQETKRESEQADITILAAAVADYTPVHYSEQKMKKDSEPRILELMRTKDIAKAIGSSKRPGQILVGFAMETENEIENARKKLTTKNFDFIVLNSLHQPGAGFRHDTNQVTFIYPDNKVVEFELKSKKAVARDIADAVLRLSAENK